MSHSMSADAPVTRLFVRRMRKAVAVAVLALFVAGLLKYLVIEPEAIGFACSAPMPPGWCMGRQAVIIAFNLALFGKVAVVVALFALVGRSAALARPAALLAIGLGACGCMLYDVNLGAIALVIGLIAAAREAAAPNAG